MEQVKTVRVGALGQRKRSRTSPPKEHQKTAEGSTGTARSPVACGPHLGRPESPCRGGVGLAGGALHAPGAGCGHLVREVNRPRDNKGKVDETHDASLAGRVRRPARKTADWTVQVGSPAENNERDLRECLGAFGEVPRVPVNREINTGHSQGLGCVRLLE